MILGKVIAGNLSGTIHPFFAGGNHFGSGQSLLQKSTPEIPSDPGSANHRCLCGTSRHADGASLLCMYRASGWLWYLCTCGRVMVAVVGTLDSCW